MAEMLARGEWITLGAFVFTVLCVVCGQLWAKGSLEGTVKTRLDGHDGRLSTIEAEQVRQWESIGEQGQSIARLEGSSGNVRGKAAHP